MWPTLQSVIRNLPEVVQLMSSATFDQSIVCGTAIWTGKSPLKFTVRNQLLVTSVDNTPALLHRMGSSLSYISAVITHCGIDEDIALRLLQKGISVVCLPETTDLCKTAALCDSYILRHLTSLLQGEVLNDRWPPLNSLYFSSHFENILNGLQYVSGYENSGNTLLPTGPYQLLLLRLDPSKGTPEHDVQLSKLLTCLDDTVSQNYGSVSFPVSVRDTQHIVCLLGPNAKNDAQYATRHELELFVGQIRSRCKFALHTSVLSAVFSPPFHDLRLTFSSYQECLFSGSVYRDLYGSNYTLFSEEMNLYYHLLRHMTSPHITRQYEHCWAVLQDYDLNNRAELTSTLEAFLKCNGKNAAAAAEYLNIHRNTIHNRLLTIEKLLHINLSDPETIFYLSLCLRLKAITRATVKYDYFSPDKPVSVFNESILPVSREIRMAYDLLSQHNINCNTLISILRSHGLQDVTVNRVVANNHAYSDFLRILIPGSAGKQRGMHAPTLGIVGRLSGIKLQSQPLSLVSDADGAIAAIALALKLAALQASGEGPLGDVIITTQLALHASASHHSPASLTMSPIDTLTACRMEVDPQMDAVVSISVCRATHWVNTDGIAITPPVKEGLILPPCDSLLHLMESVTGMQPVVFPLSSYDITPANNGLYHVNSMMQPSLATAAPVIGLALTSVNLVPGTTPRHNDLLDVELAIRFTLELIYGFTSGNISLYDDQQFELAKKLLNGEKSSFVDFT